MNQSHHNPHGRKSWDSCFIVVNETRPLEPERAVFPILQNPFFAESLVRLHNTLGQEQIKAARLDIRALNGCDS